MQQITALDEEGCAVTTALERLPFAKIICRSRARHRILLKLLLIMSKMIHDTTKMGTIMMKSYKVHVILTLVLNFPRK